MPETKPCYPLEDIARYVEGRCQGDVHRFITGIASLEDAQFDPKTQTGDIAFLHRENYKKYLPETRAAAVLLREEDASVSCVPAIIVKDPYLAYAKVANLFDATPKPGSGIHPTAVIDPSANIHPTAAIGPHVVIEADVEIGEEVIIDAGCYIGLGTMIAKGTRLFPRVTLYHQTHIGAQCVIHSGTVIGADGFGFAPADGYWHKIAQLGRVVISDKVEIGANTTIDRGALSDTVIEKGVILDNQIQIGHGVRIGAYTAIAGCVGIAGSTKIGKKCLIGGATGIGGHLEIVDGVIITGMAMVTNSITSPGVYSSGIPLQPNRQWRKNVARFGQLDELTRRIKLLEKQLQQGIMTDNE